MNFFKGIAVGLATLVPGVSGGTMAIVLGIYNCFSYVCRTGDHNLVSYSTGIHKYNFSFNCWYSNVLIYWLGKKDIE